MHYKKVLAMGVVFAALLAAGIFSVTRAGDNGHHAWSGSMENTVTAGMFSHHMDMGMPGLNDTHESGTRHGSMISADEGQDKDVYYTCPMHPEVRSDKPGKCPKCGMTLVKKEKN